MDAGAREGVGAIGSANGTPYPVCGLWIGLASPPCMLSGAKLVLPFASAMLSSYVVE